MPALPLSPQELAEADRLKQLFKFWQETQRDDAGRKPSQEAAAAMLGFNQSALSQYLGGRIPLNLDAAIKFADLLGCKIDDFSPRIAQLAIGYASATVADSIPGARQVVIMDEESAEIVLIPKVTLKLSAGVTGFQTEPDRRDGGTYPISRHWVERNGYDPRYLLAIEVEGPSMQPRLNDGDLVIVNTADKRPVGGRVFAANYKGQSVVKRLQRDAGQWWLTSDNPDQVTFHRNPCRGDDCIIIGRVVKKESDEI